MILNDYLVRISVTLRQVVRVYRFVCLPVPATDVPLLEILFDFLIEPLAYEALDLFESYSSLSSINYVIDYKGLSSLLFSSFSSNPPNSILPSLSFSCSAKLTLLIFLDFDLSSSF
jgi:hypothetical protein